MSFTGKATFSAGNTLPEIAEDISDIVSIVSPYETALLDYLGDSNLVATSTVHEWLEDNLQPNQTSLINAVDEQADEIQVQDSSLFKTGDLIRFEGYSEIMQVNAASVAQEISVTRGYGGSSNEEIVAATKIYRISGAAYEGENAPKAIFTNRKRCMNYTQIFTSAIEVSGSMLATKQVGVADELDYQKQERLRELLRDLENSVINGMSPSLNQQGSHTTRRTMRGLIPSITSNITDASSSELTEEALNEALRSIWEQSAGHVDTIVVNGYQKRKINNIISGNRSYSATDNKYSDLVDIYESDFGVCRVVLSRWVPRDKILLLDSSRVSVVPLNGRSFHYKPLASAGDSESGQLIGEYTLEFRNENAHGLIENLDVS
ncbi:DUF5309 family protein [Planctomycetota bacterium]|nr:DUF5309 family protein [Planctomycetota bacterium]